MKKRILALVLGIVMVASSLTACGSKNNTEGEESKSTTAATTKATTEGSGSTEPVVEATYTFNDYVSGSPATWNPHEWETNEDSYIMGYTQLGLYNFYLNDAKDGYQIVPEMAAADPVDVTKDYAGNATYGVPADATSGYAFRIALRPDACWEDGTPITSEDYVYSMQQMLNPEIKNYRASSYYEGQLILANAKNYANNDQAGQPIYESLGTIGYDSVDAAVAAGVTDLYIDMANAWGVTDEDGNGIFSITDETKLRDEAVAEGEDGDWISPKEVYDGNFANGMPYASYQADYIFAQSGVYEETAWESVGIIAEDDYNIVLVLASPITEFYLYYNLSSNWIVKKELYEANMTQTGDIKKTTYGTAVNNYMSYGPYKLTEYQVDKQITMEKNELWYGYNDPFYEGKYQTTKINTQVIETQATALQMFLKGELDNVSLTSEDMENYRTSDFVLYTPQSYTTKLTFNSDKAALKALQETAGANINMTIMAYEDFRHAIALSIDRTAFAEQCTATHQPGYGLLNYMYVYDPDTGALYRDSEQAKQALCDAYGVSDESEITGFDKVQASALYTKAYNDALAAGDIKATDTVQINIHMYQSDDAYKKMFNFIEAGIQEASKGTPLEGKIKCEFVEDPNYYDNAMEGKAGIIFSTWGGSSMDPFGIMQCYVDPSMYFEVGFDHNAPLTLTINGKEETRSYYEWYQAIAVGDYKMADNDTKLQILAGFESAYLQLYVCTPMYYRTSASLQSRKVTNATDEYVQIVGFGGIPEMTYNYTDEEWAAYLAENNNQLTY